MVIAWALGRKTNSESKESDRMLPEEADIDAQIDEIISSTDQLTLKNRIKPKYIPPWREQCYKGEWPISDLYTPGEFHEPSPTWIKVSKICKLSPLIYDSTKIIKWEDKKPLESFIPPLRSRVYIVDGNWKCGK